MLCFEVSVGICLILRALTTVRQAKRPILLKPPLFYSYTHQLLGDVPNSTAILISRSVLASNVWTNNHQRAKKMSTTEP